MELKVDIGFDQLLEVIRQLPDDKRSLLKAELSASKATETPIPKDTFLEFLLNGPVMSDEQYKEYLETRKHFNAWRTK